MAGSGRTGEGRGGSGGINRPGPTNVVLVAAICGLELSRRAERFALAVTGLAVLLSVLTPMFYVVAVAVACASAAMAAPAGRRSVTALAVWFPVSAAVVVGLVPVG